MWVTVIVIIAVYAWLRAPGIVAIGSDNDEYQLVAKALMGGDAPIVAGVEGTKYPLGYPALLALFMLARIPLYAGTVALNVVALVTAAVLTATIVVRTPGKTAPAFTAGLAAAALIVTSRTVWQDMFSTMPEILLLAVIAGVLAAVNMQDSTKRTVVLTVLCVVAVLLKTLALPLILGGFGIIWLFQRHIRVLIPPVAATATAVAGMLWMRRYPSHTTGYVDTFLLNDPDDAALGSITATGVIERTIRQIPDALRDIGYAIGPPTTSRMVAIIIAIVTLAIGVWAAKQLGRNRQLGQFALGAVIAYTVAMALWPYNSPRFGMPLVPIAALGAGWLIRTIATKLKRPAVTVTLVTALLIGLVGTSITGVRDDGESQRQLFPTQHAARDAVVDWIEANAPTAKLVSFDYREIANRTDGTVHPIGYTSDPAALRAQLDDADLLIVMRFYGKRTRQAQVLLDTYPGMFTEVFSVNRGTVYAINHAG